MDRPQEVEMAARLLGPCASLRALSSFGCAVPGVMIPLLNGNCLSKISLRNQHRDARSEEHTSELQSLMRISYAVFCLKKKTLNTHIRTPINYTHNITTTQRNHSKHHHRSTH